MNLKEKLALSVHNTPIEREIKGYEEALRKTKNEKFRKYYEQQIEKAKEQLK